MSEHTPGPWVQFADQGKCIAIMPAGREGDICTFDQSPSDADAMLMTLAPALVRALTDIIEANNEFRDGMPKAYRDGREWEGDPLQDACDVAARLIDLVGGSRE